MVTSSCDACCVRGVCTCSSPYSGSQLPSVNNGNGEAAAASPRRVVPQCGGRNRKKHKLPVLERCTNHRFSSWKTGKRKVEQPRLVVQKQYLGESTKSNSQVRCSSARTHTHTTTTTTYHHRIQPLRRVRLTCEFSNPLSPWAVHVCMYRTPTN